jgi:hypothetical protein
MKFTVSGENDRKAVKSYIDKLPDGKTFTVEVSARKETRSLNQNRLYWLWLTCIEQETGNDREILHHEFGMMFLPKKTGTMNGKTIELPVSTSTMNSDQFKQYLNKVQIFASAELGIVLPDPNDLIFESFYQMYKDRI